MPPHRLGAAFFVCLAVLLVAWCGQRDFARQGDGWEYLITTEAFVRHGSPEILDADIAAVSDGVERWLHERHGPTPAGTVRSVIDAELAHRFIVDGEGRRYAMHFWLYPLAAVPARLLLGAVGWPAFNALIVTNAALAALAFGVVLFRARGTVVDRLALATMLAMTPVLWYITFTGVEIFCWTFAVLALVALDRGRLGLAAGLAGVAAAQNPPLVFMALVPVVAAAWQRQRRTTAQAIACASLSLLPTTFYAWRLQAFSPLTRAHVDLGGITAGRTAALLFDLDYGLVAYVPVLVVLLPFAIVRTMRTRDVHAALLFGALIGMAAVAETQTNWNSAGMGLHRYLVWMLPVLTWVVVRGWATRARMLTAGAMAVTSGVVLLAGAPAESNWLAHRPAAAWMMRAAPAWYHPEFEVFAERSAHAEAPPGWMIEGRRDGWMELLPVAHGREDGEVTTMLVHADSADRLRDRFRVDDGYWPTLSAIAAAAATPVYVHPPAGTVWSLQDRIDGTYQPATVASERVRVTGSASVQ